MNVNELAGDINITFSFVTDGTWSYSAKENLTHFPQKTRTSISQVISHLKSRHKLLFSSFQEKQNTCCFLFMILQHHAWMKNIERGLLIESRRWISQILQHALHVDSISEMIKSQWGKWHPQNCVSRENILPKLLGNSLFPQNHTSEFATVKNYQHYVLRKLWLSYPTFLLPWAVGGAGTQAEACKPLRRREKSPSGGSMHSRAALERQVLTNLQSSVLSSGWQNSH